MADALVIGGEKINSRIFLLMGYFPANRVDVEASRVPAGLRDNSLRLGSNRMSGGSCIAVCGRTDRTGEAAGQFEIADERDVAQLKGMITGQGYEPVRKDWQPV